MRIVAVSDPAHPVEVGFYNPGVLIWDVAIAGNYAYTVTKGDDRLRIIDISDPAHPVEVGFLALPHCAWSVVVKEGYAYVANYGWGLRIINVSDPANPVEVGSYRDPQEQIVDVAVAGDYAYIAEIGGRLDIINISDPANPVKVSELYTFGGSFDVEVTGEHAYVTNDWGMIIVNVSDSFNPTLVSLYSSNEQLVQTRSIAIASEYAYLISWIGLEVIKVSDPYNPYRVGFYPSPGGLFTSQWHGIPHISPIRWWACGLLMSQTRPILLRLGPMIHQGSCTVLL